MKYYALFYQMRARKDGSAYYHNPCGDRSIIQLDGRWSVDRMMYVAREEAKKRGFVAFDIQRGDNLLNLFTFRTIRPVEDKSNVA